MLELVSYGLTGLAALVIVASCLAYSGEFSLWGKRSIDLMDRRRWPLSLRVLGVLSPTLSVSGPSESVQGEALYG
jgi:hypothetical protein